MKSVLFKILILIVGVFYLIAFFEIDIKDYKQTWNDQYDSYILNVKCDQGNAVDFGGLNAFEPQEPAQLVTFPDAAGHILFGSFISNRFTVSRLYLRHEVFLI